MAGQESELLIYTRYLIEGIDTGAADLDNDGEISVKELHNYTSHKVRQAAPAMKPQIYAVEAIRLNPDEAVYHNNLGYALYKQDELEKAIEEYREAIRLNPDEAWFHNNLGNALYKLYKQDELEKAIEEYREAIRLNPNNAVYHNNVRNAYQKVNEVKKTLTQLFSGS
ncbi:MAG: tetratricopeptide repeat protein [Hormoscilla sp. GM7CHS1pb]|nr:tetratricopeptide repeat protein [Hormoscilla sp. GM7CHS1pb]